ncbi:hypothetical protein SK128_021316, partial [Halocaridina rubra]
TYCANNYGHKRTKSEMQESGGSGNSAPFTRSAMQQLAKTYCIFCQNDDGERLYNVQPESEGKALRRDVEIFQDRVLLTRLNNAISPNDAHTIDVKHH